MVSISNDKIYVMGGALIIFGLIGYLIYWFILRTARSEVVRMYKRLEKTKQKIKQETVSQPPMEFKPENSNVLTAGIDDNDSYVDPMPSPSILQ